MRMKMKQIFLFTKNLLHNRKAVTVLSGILGISVILSAVAVSAYFMRDRLPDSNSLLSENSAVSKTITGTKTDESTNPASTNQETNSQSSETITGNKNVAGTVANGNATLKKINADKRLPKFKSYLEILALFKSMNVTRTGVKYDTGMPETASGEMKNGTSSSQAYTGAAPSADSSSTNTQVNGIDEGDIIKNDGKYLYLVRGNTVLIYDVYPVSTMKKVSTISLEANEQVRELYLTAGKLVIISSNYENMYSETSQGAADAISGDTKAKVAADCLYYGRESTKIRIYDISKKENPVLSRSIVMDGSLVSSREKSGKFYIITNRYVYNIPEENAAKEDVLPSYSDSLKGQNSILIQADEIEYCPENIAANYLLIGCFDVGTQVPLDVETILGAGNNVYMSHQALYIAQPFFRYIPNPQISSSTPSSTPTSSLIISGAIPETKTETTTKPVAGSAIDPSTGTGSSAGSVTGSGTGVAVAAPAVDLMPQFLEYEEGTIVLKFNFTSGGVQFAVAGEIAGQILNQYSMDEYNGSLRIAATNWDAKIGNAVYILDVQMKLSGKITGIAPGERIYAVRFMEKTGYVVTFRNMDPLFVIDLSNPAAPKITGELEIPGFSNYLHPVSSTLLLGIGQNTETIYRKDETGKEIVVGSQRSGLKVSLFDVSDPQKPREVDTLVFGGVGSTSETQYNPKSFVWWNIKSMALFPAYLTGVDGGVEYNDKYSSMQCGALAFTVSGSTLVEKARLFPENSGYDYNGIRTAYINDVIYVTNNSGVYAYSATDYKLIKNAA